MRRRDRGVQTGPQPPFAISNRAWTADNFLVTVSATVPFEITDPSALSNFYQATEMAVITALRNVVGGRDLAHTLDRAPELSREILARSNELIAAYGVIVTGVEVTGIVLSPDAPRENFMYVRTPGFLVVRRGYDREYVDSLLDRAAHALGAEDGPACAAVGKWLTGPIPVRLRGYDRVQVDSHLGRLSKILQLQSGT